MFVTRADTEWKLTGNAYFRARIEQKPSYNIFIDNAADMLKIIQCLALEHFISILK